MKIIDTLSHIIVNGFNNTILQTKDGILNVIENIKNPIDMAQMYPKPKLEHNTDSQSTLTFQYEDGTLSFSITWEKREANGTWRYRIAEVKPELS